MKTYGRTKKGKFKVTEKEFFELLTKQVEELNGKRIL